MCECDIYVLVKCNVRLAVVAASRPDLQHRFTEFIALIKGTFTQCNRIYWTYFLLCHLGASSTIHSLITGLFTTFINEFISFITVECKKELPAEFVIVLRRVKHVLLRIQEFSI